VRPVASWAALAAAVAVYAGARAVLGLLWAPRLRALRGLRGLEAPEEASPEEPLDLPWAERLLKPALGALGRTLGRLLPRDLAERTREELARAGLGRLRPADWLGARVLAAILAGAYVAAVARGLPGAPVWAVLALPLGWQLPRVYLSARVRRRAEAIRRELPDALDLVTVCVEAGLGFDQALLRVAERATGPLGAELARVLRDQRLGTPRREALAALVARTEVPELAAFVRAVLQGEERGARIGHVLRLQAEALRTHRRQRAEEAALQAPVKMAFPMVFLILPALLLVVLGPAVLEALQAFRGR